jgi:hypothetical protein
MFPPELQTGSMKSPWTEPLANIYRHYYHDPPLPFPKSRRRFREFIRKVTSGKARETMLRKTTNVDNLLIQWYGSRVDTMLKFIYKFLVLHGSLKSISSQQFCDRPPDYRVFEEVSYLVSLKGKEAWYPGRGEPYHPVIKGQPMQCYTWEAEPGKILDLYGEDEEEVAGSVNLGST